MATKYQEITYSDLGGGVNTAAPPHLVSPREWTILHGMRYERGILTQVAHHVSQGQIDGALSGYTLGAFWTSLNCRDQISLNVVTGGATTKSAWVYSLGLGGSTNRAVKLTKGGAEFALNVSNMPTYITTTGIVSVWDYMAMVKYMNSWFLTNSKNALFQVSNGGIYQPSGTLPKAAYITTMFDHIVVGNYTLDGVYYPRGVAWSHLYDPWTWTPSTGNEADSFEFEEFCSQDGPVSAVTGFSRVNNTNVVFTDSSIIAMEYQGLPKVMSYTPIRHDVGNSLPRGLVKYGNYMFFFDYVSYNFYLFDGQNLKQIGDKILPLMNAVLPATLATSPNSMLDYVQGYALPKWNLVCWAIPYLSNQGGTPKYIPLTIAYNPMSDSWTHWYHDGLNPVFPIGSVDTIGPNLGYIPHAIDEYTNTPIASANHIDDMTNVIDEDAEAVVNANPSIYFRLQDQYFFAGNGVYREINASSTTADRWIDPVLETGDRVYGSLDKVKEIGGIQLHASYTIGAGIEVSLSVRNSLADAVTYNVMGVWNPSLPNKMLSFTTGVTGKIFRWRFRGLGQPEGAGHIFGMKLYAFTEFVYGANAER